ncbi:hypothetical protein [Streptomyces nogalater]|uniref:Lsr2 protein n=1 Tax=Streptomyces nogalater TaxID=38314 RepID=A0ABW0W8L7_STRNO
MARPKKRPDPALVQQAADKLDSIGEPVLAAAVRETLPELTRPRVREGNPTLPLYTYRDTWTAAQKAGSIPDLVEEGFTAFLAGRFKPKPAPRGAGGAKSNFSARATAERRQEVADYVEAHADELGWSPSPQQVAAAWLEHRFGPHKRT